MRMRRMVAEGVGYYHVISRIAGQLFLVDDREKDVLMRLMFDVAVFSGVEVLTFALMDNHFHILLKVPLAHEVDDAELVGKMRVLYGDEKTNRILGEWEAWDRRGLSFKGDDAKAALRRRMFDLSQFCKTLKETYSMSYNFRHAHVGTIWGSRFKSILLSPDYKTLMTVGSYIDLNPVRAEIVEEPGEYRWSGYGTAIRGNMLSRNGICAMVSAAYARREVSFHNALDVYASALDGWIETPTPEAPEADIASSEGQGKKQPEKEEELRKPAGRPVFIPEKVEADIRQGAKLTLFAMLRCKVRYFSHGLALGPLSFVRHVIETSTSKKDPSRPWGCCEDVELYNARWLRGEDKISVPKRRVD
ncbi:MAG: hypothetical protein PHW08_12645 [Kiritimatiellae bacterium]|nr:hypothetical protein [Kiritimatiellia bacterium]